MTDEFLRDRPLESQIAETDLDTGRFQRVNRMAALMNILKEKKGDVAFTYVNGLAVRAGDKVYGPDGNDITPKSPELNL